MLYILFGHDDYTLALALSELKKEADTASAFSAGITTLEGHQISPDQLRSVCAAAPFLSGKRLVIVYGLLQKFDPKSKKRRARKSIPENSEEGYKSYADVLLNIPESTIIALVEGPLSGNNPLLKALDGKAAVKNFPSLKDAQLRLWIQKHIKDFSGSMSTQAMDSLVKLVGSNLWVMKNELEKLVLFVGNRRIEEGDVKTLVSQSEQADIFSMVDAICELKEDIASRRMQSLLRRGSAPTYLLSMLCRQIRLIVRAMELKKQGASEAEIQSRLEVSSSFIIRKTLEQASRYSPSRLRELYRKLLASDIWIKTGTYDGELAVTILISDLCRNQHP